MRPRGSMNTLDTVEPVLPARFVQIPRRAGTILGIGMGGFLDGITLHQIARWHNMGSSVLPPTTMEAMERNMVWDGLFHAATWLVTLVGIYLLVAHARRGTPMPSPRA